MNQIQKATEGLEKSMENREAWIEYLMRENPKINYQDASNMYFQMEINNLHNQMSQLKNMIERLIKMKLENGL